MGNGLAGYEYSDDFIEAVGVLCEMQYRYHGITDPEDMHVMSFEVWDQVSTHDLGMLGLLISSRMVFPLADIWPKVREPAEIATFPLSATAQNEPASPFAPKAPVIDLLAFRRYKTLRRG